MNICILGPPKTGKTRSADTLPGPTVLFNFDPQGYAAIRRPYEMLPPGSGQTICTTLQTHELVVLDYCTTQTTISVQPTREARMPYGGSAYQRFIMDANAALTCPRCVNIVIDGLTGLGDVTLLAVLMLNKRAKPNLMADFGDAIEKLMEICSVCSAAPDKNFILMCHTLIERDELTGRIQEMPLVYGKQLPGRLLALFDTVLRTDVQQGVYAWLTRPTPLMQTIGSRSRDNMPERILQDFSALLTGSVQEAKGGGQTRTQVATS